MSDPLLNLLEYYASRGSRGEYERLTQECGRQELTNFKKILEKVLIQTPKYHKKMIRVKVLCNWCSSRELCDEWNRMSQGEYKWNDIQITWETQDIDYYVIINKPPEGEFYIAEKTIIFHMEPWCYGTDQHWGIKTWGEWALPDEKKFLQVRNHKKYHCNGFWQISHTYHTLKSRSAPKNTDNKISTIVSSKYYDPGHIKRIDFLKFLERKNDTNLSIDIWGYDNNHGFKNYRGRVDTLKKEEGIEPYKYYFMCENNQEYNYMTEKIWEPILCETLCFYWGAPNLSEYIDPRAYVELDMDDFEKAYDTIKNAICQNLWEERLSIIRKEKTKILEKYNFFPTLESVIKENI